MKYSTQLTSALVTGLLAVGSLVVLGNSANAAGCGTYAHTPVKVGQSVIAKAGRSGCSANDYVKVETFLYHYQPAWLDEVLQKHTYNSASNVNSTLKWTRPNTSTAIGWDFYSKATSNTGQSAKSSNARLW